MVQTATRKGIVLAGGAGTRLNPLTRAVSKQLLPVYDKPMIYYPISVLMLAGIRDILLISTPDDLPLFRKLLGDGSNFGISLSYAEQAAPNGIAEAYLIGEEFLSGAAPALVLGDNLFFGHDLSTRLKSASGKDAGALIFGYNVGDPERYGVATIDANNKVLSIEEKPASPKSNIAVTGLYFHDADAPAITRGLKPSPRGELEITDVNNHYLHAGRLSLELLGRGYAWLDTGTPDALLDAGEFIGSLERRQGLKVACLEEIGWRNGWIQTGDVKSIANSYGNSDYARYLLDIIASGHGAE